MNPWLLLNARIGATYADDDYMSTFFGVTAAQAASSGLAQYTAEAGIKDAHVELGATISLSDRLDLKPRVRYKRLLGDTVDSPIVESENQLSGSLSLTYRFGGSAY